MIGTGSGRGPGSQRLKAAASRGKGLAMTASVISSAVTEGIRVTVSANYVPEQSAPAAKR